MDFDLRLQFQLLQFRFRNSHDINSRATGPTGCVCSAVNQWQPAVEPAESIMVLITRKKLVWRLKSKMNIMDRLDYWTRLVCGYRVSIGTRPNRVAPNS